MAVPQDHGRATAELFLMDAHSWHRVKEVIEALLARPPAERAETIQQMCGDDVSLRAEVESLFAAIQAAEDFIN